MVAFKPISEPGSALSVREETIFLHLGHHLDCVISSDTVVFSAGGAISSTIRAGRFVPSLSCKSVPQQGQASRGMSFVSSGTTLDFLPLPQPGLFFRFFFRRFLGGFGLPSLSHSGFFELGSLTCLFMSRISRPLLCS